MPFLAAVLLMLSFVTFPAAPPDNSVDSSLSGVLSYAHQQGLQFGPDLVFTYGPLGFLIFFYFSPWAAGLRMAADVALCLVTATGLCLVAWRLPRLVAVAVAGPVLLDGAQCAGSGRPGHQYRAALLGLAVFRRIRPSPSGLCADVHGARGL